MSGEGHNTRLRDDRANEIADTIDAADQMIADGQSAKRDTFQNAREELEAAGLDKDTVKAELAGLKRAIRIRQMRRTKPEKLDAEEASEVLALGYLDKIDPTNAPRATPASATTVPDGD